MTCIARAANYRVRISSENLGGTVRGVTTQVWIDQPSRREFWGLGLVGDVAQTLVCAKTSSHAGISVFRDAV